MTEELRQGLLGLAQGKAPRVDMTFEDNGVIQMIHAIEATIGNGKWKILNAFGEGQELHLDQTDVEGPHAKLIAAGQPRSGITRYHHSFIETRSGVKR